MHTLRLTFIDKSINLCSIYEVRIKGLQKDILSQDVYLAVYNSADTNGVGEKRKRVLGVCRKLKEQRLGYPV